MAKKKVIDVLKQREKETKAEIFIRLAIPRVEKILKALRILGNCSNRSTYEYTQDQIQKIFSTIHKATDNTAMKFSKSKKEQESFKF